MVSCTFTTCLNDQQQEYLKQKEERLKKKDHNTAHDSNGPTNTTTNPTGASPVSESPNASNFTRTNFNLRGHKADVKLVRWNEPYQKLATCDSKGVIYVWIRYEGRWSIELINDRGHAVTDFAWSHDGRMAVITYVDGFVLVGSVNGQRYWSHMYELANKSITCATWAPNDTFILLGISDGSVIFLDENGTIVGRHNVKNDTITSMAFNCPKFFIEELININNTNAAANSSANNANNGNGGSAGGNHFSSPGNRVRLSSGLFQFSNNENQINNRVDSKLKNKVNNASFILACSFKSDGVIYLMKTPEDIDPVVIDTKLEGVKFEWSSSGHFLAVGGYEVKPKTSEKTNFIYFYNPSGAVVYKIMIPSIVIKF
jgi:hypothetical protein